jgi:hypothetical protein
MHGNKIKTTLRGSKNSDGTVMHTNETNGATN